MPTVRAAAPAKINLCLHVTGRRPDGYHLIDSIVAFAAVGDVVTVAPADALTLSVDGPFGPVLQRDPGENLVLRAAAALRRLVGTTVGAHIRLTKNLPVAAGLGGGSSDAAAAARALSRLWRISLTRRSCDQLLLPLGADLPVCMAARPTRVTGIGDRLVSFDGPCADLHIVLANPGVAVPTGAVFDRLDDRFGAPIPVLASTTAPSLLRALAACRNDLEPPARRIAPQIDAVLAALNGLPQCAFARMSGSGATCFALFESAAAARRGAQHLARTQPDWWVVATRLNGLGAVQDVSE